MPFDPSKFRARLASEQKWYSISNLAGGEADVMLYGEIGWLGTAADEFVRDIKGLNASQINLHLSSPGGSVFDGIAIMNALRAHPANVTVYVDSLAASIASVIAMAGDRIVARQAAEFMIHEAAGLAVGDADEMRAMAELLDRQSDKIAGIYAARAGGTVEDWRAAMAKETWYSAQEAVDAGLADEIDEPFKETRSAPDEMAVAASWDLSVFRYAGREHAPAPQPIAARSTVMIGEGSTCTMPTAGSVLTADVASLVGEQIVNALRASVTPAPAEPAAPTADDATVSPDDTALEDGGQGDDANEERPPAAVPAAPNTDNQATATPQAEQRIVVQVDTAALAAALREVSQTAPPTPQPVHAPAAPSLAARAAHLKPARPAAPTWRDRVAHLTPPSSATTRPAP